MKTDKLIGCFLISLSLLIVANNATAVEGVSAKDALQMLLAGNKRFVNNKAVYPHQSAERRLKTAKEGQRPFAAILSCSDSRVPLETIFDAGIGDIFVVRLAGNIADKTAIGSIEYAVNHLGTNLIVVLGHTKCGAITAVVNNDHVGGNIKSITDKIKPAVARVRAENKGLSQEALILESTKANVGQSIDDIVSSSQDVRQMLKDKKIQIVGALYDVESGEVKL